MSRAQQLYCCASLWPAGSETIYSVVGRSSEQSQVLSADDEWLWWWYSTIDSELGEVGSVNWARYSRRFFNVSGPVLGYWQRYSAWSWSLGWSGCRLAAMKGSAASAAAVVCYSLLSAWVLFLSINLINQSSKIAGIGCLQVGHSWRTSIHFLRQIV